jgi:serine/threonine protein kinase
MQVNSDPKSALGTLAYTAPEALMHNFFDGSCSDVWCCGVMLYIMVTGAYFIRLADARCMLWPQAVPPSCQRWCIYAPAI